MESYDSFQTAGADSSFPDLSEESFRFRFTTSFRPLARIPLSLTIIQIIAGVLFTTGFRPLARIPLSLTLNRPTYQKFATLGVE